MSELNLISVNEFKTLIKTKADTHILDIRDHPSFSAGHIHNAFHLTDDTLQEFVNKAEFEDPVVVICYKGISSQKVGQYLLELGFDEVYSLNGGYQAWAEQEQVSL